MRFNLSAIAVRERAVTLFFILLLMAAGAYAFLMLGRAEDPGFTLKNLTVTTAWPGATPREMQDLVAEPLEKRLQELTWYDRVETTTRPGYAYMTLTLKNTTPPSVVQEEFYQARKKLADEARNLPSGVLGPFVNDEYSDVSFALYALKAAGMPMRELARQAETIRQDLLHVPGIKKVNILGERREQIFVEFSYAKLATLGVSAQDIVAALQRQNTVTPAGSIDTRGPRVFIRVDGAYDDVQAIADTPIVAAGRTLKLSDIAGVRRGYEDPPTYLIRHQGEPVVMLGAVMQERWDGLALGKALEIRTAEIANTLALIRSSIDALRNSEKKVAKCVLEDPGAVITSSITELAEKSGTSEPTVIRFCRKLGLGGYMELRLNLARDLPSSAQYIFENVSAATPLPGLPVRFLTPIARRSATR